VLEEYHVSILKEDKKVIPPVLSRVIIRFNRGFKWDQLNEASTYWKIYYVYRKI